MRKIMAAQINLIWETKKERLCFVKTFREKRINIYSVPTMCLVCAMELTKIGWSYYPQFTDDETEGQ